MNLKNKLKLPLRIARSILGIRRKRADKSHEHLHTLWGDMVIAGLTESSAPPIRSEHPRPQFKRAGSRMLNGWWDFAIVEYGSQQEAMRAWRAAEIPSAFDRRILVPFSPEADLSMLERTIRPDELMWYRRSVVLPQPARGSRILLHFEAVDWACAVYVNGKCAGTHEGGYLPFSFDITDLASDGGGEAVLCVCAYDPSDCGTQLRGKQRIEHLGMWYTAQSGIWQPVWLEAVPAAHIESVRIDSFNLDGTVHCTAELTGSPADGAAFEMTVLDGGTPLATKTAKPLFDSTGSVATAEAAVRIDAPELWSPEDPHLYSLVFSYGDDRVESYCAFRTAEVRPDADGTPRFMLNGQPLFLRGVLDQGYWPDGLMTAPSGDALAFDVAAAKALGFNMARKHVKLEADRWYYECDRQGLLVWQDMPSGGVWNEWATTTKPSVFKGSVYDADTGPKARKLLGSGDFAYRREWDSTCAGLIRHLGNHPCVITWSLFNEGWGQFDAADATARVRQIDGTRPIDSASGWFDQLCGDFTSVHSYEVPPQLRTPPKGAPRASVLSEFGGAPYAVDGHIYSKHNFGYTSAPPSEDWETRVSNALHCADALQRDGFSGYVYTQLTDVEEEVNGLITYDRMQVKGALPHRFTLTSS